MRIVKQYVFDQIEQARAKFIEDGFPAISAIRLADGTSFYLNLHEDGSIRYPSVDDYPAEAIGSVMSFDDVVEAVRQERAHQDRKWGKEREQSLPGFLLIAESELDEAKLGWSKNLQGRHSALAELIQVAAVCFAAIERYGFEGNAVCTNDIPDGQA